MAGVWGLCSRYYAKAWSPVGYLQLSSLPAFPESRHTAKLSKTLGRKAAAPAPPAGPGAAASAAASAPWQRTAILGEILKTVLSTDNDLLLEQNLATGCSAVQLKPTKHELRPGAAIAWQLASVSKDTCCYFIVSVYAGSSNLPRLDVLPPQMSPLFSLGTSPFGKTFWDRTQNSESPRYQADRQTLPEFHEPHCGVL